MAEAGIAMGIVGTEIIRIQAGRGIFVRIRAIVIFYIFINVFEGAIQIILAP